MRDSSLDDLFGGNDHGSHGRPSPGRRRRVKKSPLKVILPIALVLIVALLLVGGGAYAYRWVTHNVSVAAGSDDFTGTGTGEVTIEVKDGDSGSAIAKTLKDAGVIRSTGPFVTAFTNDPNASKISPGSYTLKKQMSAQAALDMLLDPASVAGVKVTLPEGQTAQKMYETLSAATGIPVENFQKAGADYIARGVPENPAKSIEGYLWPGTYVFKKDVTADQILDEMVSRMKAKLKEKGVAEKDWHTTLTLASIAEKEARNPDDYGKVIRTIDNRLAGVGEANGHSMNLQLDSTIAYFNNASTVSTTAEMRAKDSPYNTYKNPGLPVGPIANPGDATIDAAINPPAGPWLYWVTVNTDTGETKFAETKAQHDQNVLEWQNWERSKGK